MLRRRVIRTLCVLGCSLCLAQPARAELEWRGVAVGLWHVAPDTSYARDFQEIRDLGANAVILPLMVWVESVTATTIYADPDRTPADAIVQRAVRDAHATGLHVALMPIVRIAHRVDREWRGQLDPADRPAFFRSYERTILHYATLAEAEGVELFVIGSELASLESAPEWRGIVDAVRSAYCGAVTYSANWDHYAPVPFWPEMDTIALTGYYELTTDFDASEADLTASWFAIRDTLLQWKAAYPTKRLLFSEVGYPAQDGCAVTPWDYTLDNPPDLEEQRRCYAAFVNAWRDQPALAGVFFYEWSRAGEHESGSYSPRGRPAEAELRRLFR